jgi:RNA polymerase sigma factor (TIGR02999 family)
MLLSSSGTTAMDPEPTSGQPDSSVTRWLQQWTEGDEQALGEVMQRTYAELRRLARKYLRSERPDHTLQATALVHEVYLQLARTPRADWKTRAQFIGTSAQIMRHILVDHARRHAADKRGGKKLPLEAAGEVAANPDWNVVAVNDALQHLESVHPRCAQVVELRFFGGLNMQECAHLLSANGSEVSLRTVEREWRFARAWLQQYMAAQLNSSDG